MYAGRSIQAIITARGGSKGLPRKNVLPLAGKPLIQWSIDAALSCPLVDDLILSSDDTEIIEVARAGGCRVPFVRPAELAGDGAGSMPVLHHAIRAQERRFDYTVLLQPTSPLRSAADIEGAIRLCVDAGASACLSVTESKKPPQWMFYLESGRLKPVVAADPVARRQDAASAYVINGAVYVARTDWLLEAASFLGPDTLAYVMPERRSVDIDDDFDLAVAELLISRG